MDQEAEAQKGQGLSQGHPTPSGQTQTGSSGLRLPELSPEQAASPSLLLGVTSRWGDRKELRLSGFQAFLVPAPAPGCLLKGGRTTGSLCLVLSGLSPSRLTPWVSPTALVPVPRMGVLPVSPPDRNSFCSLLHHYPRSHGHGH